MFPIPSAITTCRYTSLSELLVIKATTLIYLPYEVGIKIICNTIPFHEFLYQRLTKNSKRLTVENVKYVIKLVEPESLSLNCSQSNCKLILLNAITRKEFWHKHLTQINLMILAFIYELWATKKRRNDYQMNQNMFDPT